MYLRPWTLDAADARCPSTLPGQSATSWPRPNARLTKQCAEVDTTGVDVATVRRLSEGGGFQYSNRTAPAVRNIVQQWRTNANAEQVADLARCAGVPDPNKALGAGAGDAPQERPSEARPQPAVACVYSKLSAQAAAQWLRNLHDPSTLARPSAEQQAFLQAVIDRCLREAREEAEDKPFRSEPLRAFLHGVPGAGKSQTLKWLRGFFEEICGWMQGQEFVYLASQNTQAALIDGNTLHSFAELQVKAPKQSRQTEFGPDKFVKYQRLRWLIVDECSTVALEVLAVLQLRLAEATRKKRSWKCRDTTRAAVRRRELPLRRGLLAVPRAARHLAVPKPFQQRGQCPSRQPAPPVLDARRGRRAALVRADKRTSLCGPVAEPRALASSVRAAVPRGVVLPPRLSHATRRQLVPEQRPARLSAGPVQRMLRRCRRLPQPKSSCKACRHVS